MILFNFLLPPDLRDFARFFVVTALVVIALVAIRGVRVIRGVGRVIRWINRGAISDISAGVTWGWNILTCLLKLYRSEKIVPLLHTKHWKMFVFVRFAAAEKIYTSAGKWKMENSASISYRPDKKYIHQLENGKFGVGLVPA